MVGSGVHGIAIEGTDDHDEMGVTLHPLGEELRALAPAVLSQRAVHRFLGYLDAQRERERVLRVKRGDVPELDDVLREIDDVQARVRELLATGRTPLPAEPDLEPVSEWSTDAHRRHWGWDRPDASSGQGPSFTRIES